MKSNVSLQMLKCRELHAMIKKRKHQVLTMLIGILIRPLLATFFVMEEDKLSNYCYLKR